MKEYVEGKLQTRYWEKDGQVRRKTEVIAEYVQILYRPQEYQNKHNEEPISEESPATDNLDALEADIF